MLKLMMALLTALFSVTLHAQERFILESKDLDKVRNEVHKAGGKVLREMEVIGGLVTELPAGAVKALQKKNPELKAYEDLELHLVIDAESRAKKVPGGTTVQPAQSVPWGIAAVRSREANQIVQGVGVKVCVIDTGISKKHPDLEMNIVGGRNWVFQKGAVDPNAYEDDNGHGSHVAGTIAALDNDIGVVGVAPMASLYAAKVLNKSGSGRLSDIADAIHHCVIEGVQVINMSLGAKADPTADSPMKTAVQEAVLSGVTVVVAAGNEGQDISNTVPAGYPEVIAVAAVNKDFEFASWSNYGLSEDDFSAPGVGILSTWKGTGYNTISGTSMASPHVVGVVALRISAMSLGLIGNDLGKSVSVQGAGLIDALATVLNH